MMTEEMQEPSAVEAPAGTEPALAAQAEPPVAPQPEAPATLHAAATGRPEAAADKGENPAAGKNGGANSRRRKGGKAHGKQPKLPEFTKSRKVLAVASASPVKQVAGSIAHTSRDAEPPVLSAVGPASVNQAVKAVAIARTYLVNDGFDLAVEVSRASNDSEIKDLLLLNLKKRSLPDTEEGEPEGKAQSLKSAGRSSTGQLAGAVAKNVREKKRVSITSVGQNPVFRAVDAIGLARQYLSEDGLDLDFQPSFTTVTFESGVNANAINLDVLARQA